MTRAEQSDLLRVIRQRERVAKSAAAQRAAQLRADFEQQLDRQYSFDESTVWAAALASAVKAVEAARAEVVAECERLGIPKEFAPDIQPPFWYSRGENAVKQRRTELRRLAHTHIEAAEKTARAEIERLSSEAQTDLIANGLSESAKSFLAQLPTPEALMPALGVADVERLLVERKSL